MPSGKTPSNRCRVQSIMIDGVVAQCANRGGWWSHSFTPFFALKQVLCFFRWIWNQRPQDTSALPGICRCHRMVSQSEYDRTCTTDPDQSGRTWTDVDRRWHRSTSSKTRIEAIALRLEAIPMAIGISFHRYWSMPAL